ncbi:MAG: thioredoxin domain-containing protein [Anaerolineales bacterium]|nr:thioredoxin domain-containing protein [Anaerolineales bacterium]
MTNRIKWVKLAGIICLIGAIISTGIVIWSQIRSGNVGRSGQPTSVAAKPTISNSTNLRPDVINPARGDPNRLIDETSPYLLQHAYDPVDWYPWGDEAFEKARQENKPIFLSIGYSTCHWCHVMKEESFGDSEVANLLNETFVNIIVDREERPDIDGIYSSIAVSMNGSSGWPLNVMMTYDQKPFYIATYIPKENRFGRIGMLELITQLKTAWDEQNDELLDIAEQVSAKVNQISDTSRRGELGLDEALLEKTYQQLADQFDKQNGGFGREPKFPTPHKLVFLLRYWQRTGNEYALEMVETSLQAMRRGGIFDQLGFGFHRYSIDAAWQEPHFEKMLYDQALLAMVYTEAYQVTGKSEYARTAHEIFAYVLRDMTSPSGGFYSAEDADSVGKEGGFYTWKADDIRTILNEDDAELFLTAYNVTEQGNFVDPIQAVPLGENVLFLSTSLSALSEDLQLPEEEIVSRLDAARQKLFTDRRTRLALHRDDKILTGWNGLMIAALAKAGQVYNDPTYTQAAQNAADFLLTEIVNDDERLSHSLLEKNAGQSGNVADYTFLVWGLIELYESTFDVRYLEAALHLTDELIIHFWDEESGGFYFTPDDGEDLLVRQKFVKDRDLPSGNSVAMLNLLRLSRMTANARLETIAVDIVQSFALQIEGAPYDYSLLMSAVDFGVGPSYEVIIAGDLSAADTQAMLSALRPEFIPNKVVLLRPPGESPEILRLAEYARYNTNRNGQATAYVCLNYYCELPTTDISQMLALLEIK